MLASGFPFWLLNLWNRLYLSSLYTLKENLKKPISIFNITISYWGLWATTSTLMYSLKRCKLQKIVYLSNSCCFKDWIYAWEIVWSSKNCRYFYVCSDFILPAKRGFYSFYFSSSDSIYFYSCWEFIFIWKN